MFSGRPRRNVNLGNRKVQSREDVLKHAEELRKQRQNARKQEDAARVLQSAWRARVFLLHVLTVFVRWREEHPNMLLNEFELILPELLVLPTDICHNALRLFVQSDCSRIYSTSVIEHLLPFINNSIERKDEFSVHYAFQILQFQVHAFQTSYTSDISSTTLIKYCLEPFISKEIASAMLQVRSNASLLAVVYLFSVDLERANSIVTIDTLEPHFNKLELPSFEKQLTKLKLHVSTENLNNGLFNLFKVLATNIRTHPRASGLLHAVLSLLPATREYSVEEYIKDLLAPIVVSNMPPQQYILYFATILQHCYKNRSSVMQRLLLKINPIEVWKEYKISGKEYLFNSAVEAISFFLLVSFDSELWPWTDELHQIAAEIRDRSYKILWGAVQDSTINVSGAEISVLVLLRQLHYCDTRLHLFPANFWHMPIDVKGNTSMLWNSNFSKSSNQYSSLSNGLFSALKSSSSRSKSHRGMDALLFDSGFAEETTMELDASPLARILEFAPFLIPFKTRVELFSEFINRDKQMSQFAERAECVVRREHMLIDAETEFIKYHKLLKNQVRVQMVSEGIPEAGVDGGGIMKDLLTSLCDETVGPRRFETEDADYDETLKKRGVLLPRPPQMNQITGELDYSCYGTSYCSNLVKFCFVETPEGSLVPNPVFGEKKDLFSDEIRLWYFFLGLVIGKCIYEKLLLNVEFSFTFLSKINRNTPHSTLNELALLDPELYNNLVKICKLTPRELEAAELDFTFCNSLNEVIELVPNGKTQAVTTSNRLDYVWRVANYKMNSSVRHQTDIFFAGLSFIVNMKWLSIFSAPELSKVIGGAYKPLDVDDLKKWTEVSGFPSGSKAPEYFWEILSEFSNEEAEGFLRFATSVPRSPLLGFADLSPRFGVRCAGDDQGRFPTAATCYNLLKLPNYTSKELMREKLLYAIIASPRFDLS